MKVKGLVLALAILAVPILGIAGCATTASTPEQLHWIHPAQAVQMAAAAAPDGVSGVFADILDAMVLGNGLGEWRFERGPHGFRCDWGRIVEWDPPGKLALTWHIGPKSVPQPNPEHASTVAVTFASRGESLTSVRIEHGDFARHGDDAVECRNAMASEYGWPYLLQRYVAAATRA